MRNEHDGPPPPGYVRDASARAWYLPDPKEQTDNLIQLGRQVLDRLVPEANPGLWLGDPSEWVKTYKGMSVADIYRATPTTTPLRRALSEQQRQRVDDWMKYGFFTVPVTKFVGITTDS